MSVLVILLAILVGLTGTFIAINSTNTKARVTGMAIITFVTGFLAAGAAAPQHTVVKYRSNPDPVLLKGCLRVSIIADTTHDNANEENSLAELEETARRRGCSVNTLNTDPPNPPRVSPAPPPEKSLPDESST